MSPVLAAALARAEAAGAELTADADFVGAPFALGAPEVAPTHRVSTPPGRCAWASGFLGHSTHRRGGRRS